jgi:glycosyltransferase involved in cell wall biosynthesis
VSDTKLPRTTTPLATVVCPRFPYPPIGGGVKRSLRLLECIERAGLRVRVLTDDRPLPEAIDALAQRGWSTHVARDMRYPTATRAQQHLLRLPGPRSADLASELKRATKPKDAMVQLEGPVAAAQVTWPQPVPVVFSTHNVERHLARAAAHGKRPGTRSWLREQYHVHRLARIEVGTARLADAVICVSDQDAEAFQRLSKRVIVAPNGVDEQFFELTESSSESEDILFFGQFTYEPNRTGFERFLQEGWPTLAALRPRSRLLVAGEGSRENVQVTHEAERVHVLGLVNDIVGTIARARLTVAPIWRGGGTRLKVLESLAALRPVVGTSLGVSGIGFTPGRQGLVAETPAELGQAAASLLAEPDRLSAMAHEGRSLAEPYRWTRALAPAEELYREYASGQR